jgi:thioredoxin
MNKLIFLSTGLVLLFSSCQSRAEKGNKSTAVVTSVPENSGPVKILTTQGFKDKVFNYSANKEWKYEGNLPAIIDFYADWCGPCRTLSPRVEEIAKQYDGKILVYKVNVDNERELAQFLGIQSIPTLLFIPVNGQPRATMGAIPKETLQKAVNDILLGK